MRVRCLGPVTSLLMSSQVGAGASLSITNPEGALAIPVDKLQNIIF